MTVIVVLVLREDDVGIQTSATSYISTGSTCIRKSLLAVVRSMCLITSIIIMRRHRWCGLRV